MNKLSYLINPVFIKDEESPNEPVKQDQMSLKEQAKHSLACDGIYQADNKVQEIIFDHLCEHGIDNNEVLANKIIDEVGTPKATGETLDRFSKLYNKPTMKEFCYSLFGEHNINLVNTDSLCNYLMKADDGIHKSNIDFCYREFIDNGYPLHDYLMEVFEQHYKNYLHFDYPRKPTESVVFDIVEHQMKMYSSWTNEELIEGIKQHSEEACEFVDNWIELRNYNFYTEESLRKTLLRYVKELIS